MAEALQAKITALSQAQARERRFTSDVAHELRTPLTALVGEAELLAEQLDAMPPDARRPAELLIADVARMRRLVEDLMEISRLDASGETVQREPVDLAALVAATVRSRGWDERQDRGRRCRRGHRPAAAGADRRQPRRQRGRARRRRGHGPGRRRQDGRGIRHGPGHPGRAPSARVRALLQGRSAPGPAAGAAWGLRSRSRTRACSARASTRGARRAAARASRCGCL